MTAPDLKSGRFSWFGCLPAAWGLTVLVAAMQVFLLFDSFGLRRTVEIIPGQIRSAGGSAYRCQLPTSFWSAHDTGFSTARLSEDGVLLSAPNSLRADIRNAGAGRYSVWRSQVIFAAPDNSDPRVNGRRYALSGPAYVDGMARGVLWGLLLAVWGCVLSARVSARGRLAASGSGWMGAVRAELGCLLERANAFLSSRQAMLWSVLFVTVAFGITRLPYYLGPGLVLLNNDSSSYLDLAERICNGHWPVFLKRPPGYPLFLAAAWGLFRCGTGIAAGQFLLLWGGAAWVVTSVFRYRRVLALPVGLMLGTGLSLSPVLGGESLVLSESVYTACFLWMVGGVLRAWAGGGIGAYALVSLCMGWAIWTRPAGVFLVILYGLMLAWIAWRKKGGRVAGAFALPFAVLCLGLAGYNRQTTGFFRISPPSAPFNAWLAGVTSWMWVEKPEYPEAVNAMIRDIRADGTDEDLDILKNSWSARPLRDVYAKHYNSRYWKIINPGFTNAYTEDWPYRADARATLHTLVWEAIGSQPSAYVKYVWNQVFCFFVYTPLHEMRWNYYGGDVRHVLENLLKREGEGGKICFFHLFSPEDRLARRQEVFSYYKRMMESGIEEWLYHPCRSLELALSLYGHWAVWSGAVAVNLFWPVAFALCLLVSAVRLVRSGLRHDGAFLALWIGLLHVGAGGVVSLVELALVRYVYPTLFCSYLCVLLAGLACVRREEAGGSKE